MSHHNPMGQGGWLSRGDHAYYLHGLIIGTLGELLKGSLIGNPSKWPWGSNLSNGVSSCVLWKRSSMSSIGGGGKSWRQPGFISIHEKQQFHPACLLLEEFVLTKKQDFLCGGWFIGGYTPRCINQGGTTHFCIAHAFFLVWGLINPCCFSNPNLTWFPFKWPFCKYSKFSDKPTLPRYISHVIPSKLGFPSFCWIRGGFLK